MNIDTSVWGCEPLTRGVSTRTDGKYANVMFFFDTESLAIVRKNDQFWPYCTEKKFYTKSVVKSVLSHQKCDTNFYV